MAPRSLPVFILYRGEDESARERGSKIRIERVARSSARALRDRRLNTLYRRIIAYENIGWRPGLQMVAARMKCTIGPTFRPISPWQKKVFLTVFLSSLRNSRLPSAVRVTDKLFAHYYSPSLRPAESFSRLAEFRNIVRIMHIKDPLQPHPPFREIRWILLTNSFLLAIAD